MILSTTTVVVPTTATCPGPRLELMCPWREQRDAKILKESGKTSGVGLFKIRILKCVWKKPPTHLKLFFENVVGYKIFELRMTDYVIL